MTRIIVNKSTDHAWTTFRFVFYHNINVKENVFIEREPKKTLCDTLTQAALSGLLSPDNGKLANQIARLVEIMVKTGILTVGKF